MELQRCCGVLSPSNRISQSISFIHRLGSMEKVKISVVMVLLGTVLGLWGSLRVLWCSVWRYQKTFPKITLLAWQCYFPLREQSWQLLAVCCLPKCSKLWDTGTEIIVHQIKVKSYSLYTRLCSVIESIPSFVLAAINIDQLVTLYVPNFRKLAKKVSRIVLCTLLHARRLRTSLTSFQKEQKIQH